MNPRTYLASFLLATIAGVTTRAATPDKNAERPDAASNAPSAVTAVPMINTPEVSSLKPVIGVPWGSPPEAAQVALKERGAASEMQPSTEGTNEKLLVGGGGSFAGRDVRDWVFFYHNNELYRVAVTFERAGRDHKSHLDYHSLKKSMLQTYGTPAAVKDENALTTYLRRLKEADDYPMNKTLRPSAEADWGDGLYLHRFQPRVIWGVGDDHSIVNLLLVSTDTVQVNYVSGRMLAKKQGEKKAESKQQSNDL